MSLYDNTDNNVCLALLAVCCVYGRTCKLWPEGDGISKPVSSLIIPALIEEESTATVHRERLSALHLSNHIVVYAHSVHNSLVVVCVSHVWSVAKGIPVCFFCFLHQPLAVENIAKVSPC